MLPLLPLLRHAGKTVRRYTGSTGYIYPGDRGTANTSAALVGIHMVRKLADVVSGLIGYQEKQDKNPAKIHDRHRAPGFRSAAVRDDILRRRRMDLPERRQNGRHSPVAEYALRSAVVQLHPLGFPSSHFLAALLLETPRSLESARIQKNRLTTDGETLFARQEGTRDRKTIGVFAAIDRTEELEEPRIISFVPTTRTHIRREGRDFITAR